MYEHPSLTLNERELIRQYERQRQQRLVSLLSIIAAAIAFSFGVTLFLIMIIARSNGQQAAATSRAVILAIITSASYLASWELARRDRVYISIACFVASTCIFPNIAIILADLNLGYNLFDAVISMGGIILVGTLGRPRSTAATALLASITTFAAMQIPVDPNYLRTHVAARGSGLLIIILVAFWGSVALFYAQTRSYQRTLLELSDVRIQVERARQLDELKDQFIRSVNHELRTPLMAMLGFVELLTLPQHRNSPERLDHFIMRAHRAGNSLRTLMESILDTRRLDIGAQTYTPEPVALREALDQALLLIPAEHDTQSVRRDLQVQLPGDLIAWADPIAVQQIFTNLLANALKYSDAGTPIAITARVIATSDSARSLLNGSIIGRLSQRESPATPPAPAVIEIAVRDHGFGVPPEQIPLLFQRFTRLSRDLESSIRGTGLGLYICRLLAEKMGGRIWVESTGIHGEGSTFFLQLPRYIPVAMAAPEGVAMASASM